MGNMALDDIFFVNDGTCQYFNSTVTTVEPTTQFPPTSYKCNFESNFCDWYPDPSSDAKWERQSGKSAQYGTAPLNDVTLQNSQGYYAYVSSKYSGFRSVAVLKSQALANNVDSCLEYWYQLGGPISSGLYVYTRNRNNSTLLWKRNGNNADTWSHAYVKVPANLQDRWVEFEGDVSSSLNGYLPGYVALDDVQMILGPCPATQFCDFESPDICNYQDDVTGQFKWTRHKGSTSSSNTGPPYDHTYQTSEGYYMYIETSYPTKGCCLLFI